MTTTTAAGGFGDLLGTLGGFYRDIEVAKASNNGAAGLNYRTESIPDQSSVGIYPYSGAMPAQVNSNAVSVAGVQFDSRILWATGLLVGGIFLMRKFK